MQEFKSSSDIGDFNKDTTDTWSKFLATKTFNTNRSITVRLKASPQVLIVLSGGFRL